ncbi:MAG: glycosyltransferase [Phycisphaerales bacterium]|nr:glycosyltransferase [Phycisphaerales bacterium]MCI0629914.1 glycosyltransferase [Phycisphaerales bacterium]
MTPEPVNSVAIVAIGRNEGERLRRCLQSAAQQARTIVYVDSGSTDESVEFARSIGIHVVELDRSLPFTAARSRNAGIAKLRHIDADAEFIQVVDGDCEIVDGWISFALNEMRAIPGAAVVCGRRRERYPEASVYNKLCDMEWDTPVGKSTACGGDALIRLRAFEQVGGYDDSLIAGEEPELCLRLRHRGWTIHRIDREMTLHDVNITRLGQWWRRSVRSGHAYAQGRAMHGRSAKYCVHELRSIIEWTVLLPLIAFGLAWLTWGASLLLLGGFIVLWNRVRRHRLLRGDAPHDASLYAQYCVLGKFAQLGGVVQYWWNRLRGRRTSLIEYKPSPTTASVATASQEPRS